MSRGFAMMALVLTGCASHHPRGVVEADVPRQLEAWYGQNRQAYMRKDLNAIMALRTEDFHAITPDGQTLDREKMRHYIEGLLNGIERWDEMTFTIDSLSTSGDTARAIVRQYLDRRALRPDNQYHRVQTWVTQREAWVRTPRGWLMWRVDNLRSQRRLVDGQEQ